MTDIEISRMLKKYWDLKDYNLFLQIENIFFKNDQKCINCGNPIYYHNDSRFRFNKVECSVYKIGKTSNCHKTIGQTTYHLLICEKCLIKEHPSFNVINKSRIFNTPNKITQYAFQIPDDAINSKKQEYVKNLSNLIKKYGEELGTIKYNKYLELQSKTNTFEYKQSKYNWTREQFNEYNKSRAVTLENLIKKHGEEKGTAVYLKYIDSQKMTKSKDYIIAKYGYLYYKDLCKKKIINLENFIRKHGNGLGLIKYNEWLDKKRNANFGAYSKSSQSFFKKLDELILNHDQTLETFYHDKNKEFMINVNGDLYFLDYYIKNFNICVEYNGSIWHADPNKYTACDKPISFVDNITASDIWERDAKKIKALNSMGIHTIIVWDHNAEDKLIETFNLIKNIIYGH